MFIFLGLKYLNLGRFFIFDCCDDGEDDKEDDCGLYCTKEVEGVVLDDAENVEETNCIVFVLLLKWVVGFLNWDGFSINKRGEGVLL